MKTLRQFGLLCMALAGGISTLRLARGQSTPATWIAAALAVILGLLGIAKPRALRWLFVAGLYVALPIGWLVSHALLAIIFFGLVTPTALVFRLIGRDRLRLRSAKAAIPRRHTEQELAIRQSGSRSVLREFLRSLDAGSLWLPRHGSSETRRYFRQF